MGSFVPTILLDCNVCVFHFPGGLLLALHEKYTMPTGKSEMADVMSFGATVLGSSISWGPFSADYATYMKEDTSSWKLFIYTFSDTLLEQN